MQKTILSSDSLFFKTENFVKLTKYVSSIDVLLLKLSETILLNIKDITHGEKKVDGIECFQITTEDKKYTFLFQFGYQIGNGLNDFDIIYFGFSEDESIENTIHEYVVSKVNLKFILEKTKKLTKKQDFSRLYLLSTTSVNLPRLSREQKDIVETVDKNVIVQGVAGSGKTNICIDKIIFTACQNFSGKVLYTTFSRGLLMDAKLKVEEYKSDLQGYLNSYKNGNIIFLGDKRKALENRLGIYFFAGDGDNPFDKVEKVIWYLENRVDYYLIEDLYHHEFNCDDDFVGEEYFVNNYCKNLSNYQIEKALNKLSNYSREVLYKEIYGMILGYHEIGKSSAILSKDDYKLSRNSSFSREICENIYQVAMDYYKHLLDKKLMDNNIASRKMLGKITGQNWKYSLTIIDEVQDYTKINLMLFKMLSLKVFAVGDASQMINPSYFSFAYLKNLLFEKNLTEIKELKSNYRSTPKIAEIINDLSAVNKDLFGTHNFVIDNTSVDSGLETTAVAIKDKGFLSLVASSNLDNFTFVVSDEKVKNELKKKIKNQEILTVRDIKGLERDTIVAYNLLSSNIDKWNKLKNRYINHKEADENSIFRYYYNLFYVGISRGKQNLFLVESEDSEIFNSFIARNFECVSSSKAFEEISNIVTTIEFTQDEVYSRIYDFLRLGQYDNARFTLTKVLDDGKRMSFSNLIDIHEKYIKYGKYREGGIKLWECGLTDDARTQFTLAGDNLLIDLMDSCINSGNNDLSIDVVNYFLDINDPFVRNFILEILKEDIGKIKSSLVSSNKNFKKGERNGK